MEGWTSINRFQAALDRIDSKWIMHLTFRDLTETA